MKTLRIFCASDDGTAFDLEPGVGEDKPSLRIPDTSHTILLDLPRVRKLRAYLAQLEQDLKRRPRPAGATKWELRDANA